jgi:two-component system sensor histidine kinase KdpD
MLEAARVLRRGNVDVVVGYAEAHGRAETDALLEGLEVLPRRIVEYRGAKLPEFDVDAALARRPQAVLVDELAHTNAPGLKHAKRWQDIEELLEAGISVITTINIQHIESQNDLVAQITHVVVRETVPDRVLEEADEVEVVDLPPEELLKRFQEGRVYMPEMAHRAQESFFRMGNLIALRQLALRYTAERVDRQMQDWRRDQAITRAWPIAERLVVCVGPSPQSPNVLRAAKRLASRLHADLIALYVETPQPLATADRERVMQTLHLAEQLGADIVTLTGSNVSDVALRYARDINASKIVLGKPTWRTWSDRLFGSVVDRLARRSGEIDIYVVKGVELEAPAAEPSPVRPVRWSAYGWATSIVAICTLISWALCQVLEPTNLVMIYLAGVVYVATRHGRGPSIIASILSVAAFDFFSS